MHCTVHPMEAGAPGPGWSSSAYVFVSSATRERSARSGLKWKRAVVATMATGATTHETRAPAAAST